MADITEMDAKQIYRAVLRPYKLEGLADKLWEFQGRGMVTPNTSPDVIGYLVKDTPEYQARFPGNVALEAAGKQAWTISEYLSLEQQMKAAMQGSGLPEGFYDSADDFGKFIGGGVAPAEVKRRVDEGFNAVKNANPDVVNQMKELYGVDEKGLAAYFLDPAKATPILVQQAKAASTASEANRQAQMRLTAQTAEELAAQGITGETAAAGFRQIGAQGELYTPLAGEAGAISQAEQIGAAFGTNEAARQRVETRRRQRKAAFEGGGSFATSQTGVSGLGVAK